MLKERIAGVGHFHLSFRNGFILTEIIPVQQNVESNVAPLAQHILAAALDHMQRLRKIC